MASQMEIARLAKVSQSVVSRVLTGRARESGIADETAARVQTIAEAVNYQPNLAAHMLLGRQTRLVAVIVRTFEDRLLATILEELNTRALQAGYVLLVVGFQQGRFNAQEIRLLQSYRPDAFVVVGSTDFQDWDPEFLNSGKLIIQIGLPVDDPRIITCGTDEPAAARLVVQHLGELGHRSFGIIGDATAPSRVRAHHLQSLLQEQAAAMSLSCLHLSEHVSTAAGVDAAHHLLHRIPREHWPTAIMATGDMIAISFLRTLGENGISIPGQLSLTSVGDNEYAALSLPALTTVHQPTRKLAATCIDMITGALPRISLTYTPSLKVRESTATLPARGKAPPAALAN